MAPTRFDANWTLSEASALAVHLQAHLTGHGFGVGILGSVLLKGQSKHDLDISVYPYQSTRRRDFSAAREGLLHAGLTQFLPASAVQAAWRKRGSKDEKEVEIWLYGKKRVDIFFME